MTIETVESFKASDGKLFENFEDAEQHQAKLDFYEWYNDNRLLGNYAGSYVNENDLLDWLHENRYMVRRLIGDRG